MSAPARAAGDFQLCEGCERLYPRQELCDLTSYCAGCLDKVIAQDAQSRRAVALRTLAADLRRIPGLDEADVARITGIVRQAWAA